MTQNDNLTNLNGAPTDAIDLAGVDHTALAQLDLNTMSVDDLAAWLYDHGPAHLSVIERIELAERLITRRRFIIGAGVLLGAAALGACGAGEQAAAPTATTDGMRLFDHPLLVDGPVRIPENPERIAIPSWRDLVAFLRADLNIVASIQIDDVALAQFPNWEDETSAIAELTREVNLEALVGTEPDLIIIPTFVAEAAGIDTFTAIAPTVAVAEPPQHQWLERAAIYFDAAGELEAYEALMAEYNARSSELQTLVGDVANIEVSITLLSEGDYRVFSQYSGGGRILADIGFSRPAAQLLPVTVEVYEENPNAYPEWGRSNQASLSLEMTERIGGDFILFFNLSATPEEMQAIIDGDPLLQQLDAIQNGAYFLANVNFSGTDMASAHGILDAIAEAFGVTDEFSPNPYEVKAPIPNE